MQPGPPGRRGNPSSGEALRIRLTWPSWRFAGPCSSVPRSSLQPGPGHQQARLGPLRLPGTCVFRSVTGIPCPGCGLTRSMIAGMHGRVGESWRFHRLGLLTLGFILMQFGYRAGALISPRASRRWSFWEKALNRGLLGLGLLFVLNWVVTLALILPYPRLLFWGG